MVADYKPFFGKYHIFLQWEMQILKPGCGINEKEETMRRRKERREEKQQQRNTL